MRVVVIGAEFAGLVSAACLAEVGHEVVCLNGPAGPAAPTEAGAAQLREPGLAALLARVRRVGRLRFSDELREVAEAAVVLLAVPTPPRADNGSPDLRDLMAAVEHVAPHLGEQPTLVLKSAPPPGTSEMVEARLRSLRPDLLPVVVANPDFLRQGSAVDDFLAPDRILVGSDSPIACRVLDELYEPITARGAPILFLDRRTAELARHAGSAFLATKITFINEMADLCEAVGADVAELARALGLDRRIGGECLEAGPGFGGTCVPNDVRALLAVGDEASVRLGVVRQVAADNAARKAGLAARVARALGGDLAGRRVAVLGLAFKPNTDSLREAPAVALIEGLIAAGARVAAYDPLVRVALPGVVQAADPYACADGADALVLATHWGELRRLDVARLARVMPGRAIVDLRNGFNAAELARAGFTVHGVGRAPAGPEGVRRSWGGARAARSPAVPARLARAAV
jgi:UDPglucose 6-dehydrogenase